MHNLDFLAHAASRRRSDDRGSSVSKRRRSTIPIVRTHPETGRKCLYLGDHAEYIVGMPYDEGRALIEELNALAVHPGSDLRASLEARRS